jgi:hypothetical protein
MTILLQHRPAPAVAQGSPLVIFQLDGGKRAQPPHPKTTPRLAVDRPAGQTEPKKGYFGPFLTGLTGVWTENLIRDRDQIYGGIVTRQVRAMGIRDKPTALASPWQNGFAERLFGSIRRECVDHFVVLGEAHLRRILRAYARYHNNIRTHRSLDKDAPVSLRRECLDQMVIFGETHLRRILSAYAAYCNQVRTHLALQKDVPLHRLVQRSGAIVSIPILSGLHHQYVRIWFSEMTGCIVGRARAARTLPW